MTPQILSIVSPKEKISEYIKWHHIRHVLPQTWSSLGKKKRGLDWHKPVSGKCPLSFYCLQVEALQIWRSQSPLKWNYGALHSWVAFQHFQRYEGEEAQTARKWYKHALQTQREADECTLTISSCTFSLHPTFPSKSVFSLFSFFHQSAIFLK